MKVKWKISHPDGKTKINVLISISKYIILVKHFCSVYISIISGQKLFAIIIIVIILMETFDILWLFLYSFFGMAIRQCLLKASQRMIKCFIFEDKTNDLI